MRSVRAPDATGAIEITASPTVVYDAIVGGFAEISEETVRLIPLGKRRFLGVNRRPGRAWTSFTCVTDDVRGERYAFDVSAPIVPVSRWEYVVAPTVTGCRVAESTWDRRRGGSCR
jgi:hypothetical protein